METSFPWAGDYADNQEGLDFYKAFIGNYTIYQNDCTSEKNEAFQNYNHVWSKMEVKACE